MWDSSEPIALRPPFLKSKRPQRSLVLEKIELYRYLLRATRESTFFVSFHTVRSLFKTRKTNRQCLDLRHFYEFTVTDYLNFSLK